MQYTIQKGDTLSALAKRYNTSVSALAKANNIKDVNKIYAGDSLYIPSGGGGPGSIQTSSIWRPRESGAGAWSNAGYGDGSGMGYGAASGAGSGMGFGADVSGAIAGALGDFSAPDIPAYKSAYGEKIDALMKEIENREDFRYDLHADPLYENYRDSYIRGGRLAMQESMGNAATLTGGYASSYAQGLGQQSYQAYMQALADKVPELYGEAYGRYLDEGEALYERLAAYGELEAADYARYRDSVADAQDARDFQYEAYRDAQADALARYRAALEADMAAAELAYKREQDAREQANWELEYELARESAAQKAASSKSSSSSSKSSSTASSSKSAAKGGASEEAEDIYALFATMRERERRAMLDDPASAAYIRSVLGADGYALLVTRYGG